MRIFVVLLSARFESQLQFSRRKANFSGENNIATLVRLHRAQLHFYVVFPVCSVAEYDRYYAIQYHVGFILRSKPVQAKECFTRRSSPERCSNKMIESTCRSRQTTKNWKTS